MSVILVIEMRWGLMMSLIPLLIAWCEHSIVSVFLNYHFNSSFGICWVCSPHSGLLLEYASQPLSPEWRLAIKRGNWRSKFWINDNVFCVGHFLFVFCFFNYNIEVNYINYILFLSVGHLGLCL